MLSKSLALLCLVVATAVVVSGQNPPPLPVIDSSFQSGIIGSTVPWGLAAPDQFIGYFGTDATNMNTLMVLNESFIDVNILELFPTKTQYTYVPARSSCNSAALNGSYFPLFGWLTAPNVQFEGQRVLETTIVDFWSLTLSDGFLGLFNIGNTPMRLVIASMNDAETTIFDFFNFQPGAPPNPYFDVPAYCLEKQNDDDDDEADVAAPITAAPQQPNHKANIMRRVLANTRSAGAALRQQQQQPSRHGGRRMN